MKKNKNASRVKRKGAILSTDVPFLHDSYGVHIFIILFDWVEIFSISLNKIIILHDGTSP